MDQTDSSKVIEQLVREIVTEIVETNKDKPLPSSLVSNITLVSALNLMKRMEEKAKEMGVSAVIAISNRAAHPVAVHCMDDCYIASYDVALKKAYTAVALKMSTLQLKELSQPKQSLYGIQFTNEGKIIVFGGGVPLRYKGQIIGGLGVSGGTEEQDSKLAEYGAYIVEEIL